MNKINDGGPAFPWGEFGSHLGGMTLRDYFAAKALPAIIGNHENCGIEDVELIPAVARLSYAVADAMLAARNSGSHS